MLFMWKVSIKTSDLCYTTMVFNVVSWYFNMEVYGDWLTFRKRLKWPLKELHFCTVILSEPLRLLPGRCKNAKKK